MGVEDKSLEAKVAEAAHVQELQDKIVEILKTCFDPEIPVNIYELGLIYEVNISPENFVRVKMTLTSPACPVAGTLPPEVEAKVKSVPGVADARVEVVWDPIWTPERMSEAARLQLGFDLF
jgi:FeS assembly SUF system protein